MIAVKCDFCDRHLNEPGGLLFGPPDESGMSRKKHLCVSCFRLYDVASLEGRRMAQCEEPRDGGIGEGK
jgi:hypothetical protein